MTCFHVKAAAVTAALVLAVGSLAGCDDNDYPDELSPGWTKTPCFYDESKTCWAPPSTPPQREDAVNSDHPR